MQRAYCSEVYAVSMPGGFGIRLKVLWRGPSIFLSVTVDAKHMRKSYKSNTSFHLFHHRLEQLIIIIDPAPCAFVVLFLFVLKCISATITMFFYYHVISLCELSFPLSGRLSSLSLV